MNCQSPLFFFAFVFYLLSYDIGFAQKYYHGRRGILYSVDINSCEVKEVFTLNEAYGVFFNDLAFHPNGRLYATTTEGYLEINPEAWTVLNFIPWSQIVPPSYYSFLFFDENGVGLLSKEEETGPGGRYENHIYYYDARDQKVLSHEVYPRSLFNEQILLFGRIGDYYINKGIFVQEVRLFDLKNLKYVNISTWPLLKDFSLGSVPIEFSPCSDRPILLGKAARENEGHFSRFDFKTGELIFLCENEEVRKLNGGAQATPTDFRRSPLRIDLDNDNSSGHITAGYYDTLTTCEKEVPLMDDDVELYTCGSEVDYISFQMKYYDNPLLPEERIYSEDFPGQLTQTSPSRYVWQNPFGTDEDRIKEYLSSLRYRADWINPEEKERVVMTTMHVGEDSTTSWSVYQLKQDEVYAGRDTLVEYCRSSSPVDLRSFLSGDASPNGRFDPEPSEGDGLFVPGTDPDGEYRYIVETAAGGCIDTALLTVQELDVSNAGLDTIYTCPGAQIQIGFPPGKFTDIQWWDGSSGDSIWVQETADVMRQVNVTYGSCGLNITVHILMQDPEELAGPDTTLSYCPAGREIDLSTFLPALQSSTVKLEPALQGGSLVFTPGTDPPGTYEYIVSSGAGCTDTARITLEESATKELSFEDVRLCAGQDARIGLPVDTYQNVMWWNGETGDSTTVMSADTGPFSVEAQQNGCIFRADFNVIIQESIDFPDSYPDTLEICEGEPGEILVLEVDSIELEGSIFLPGDQILFSTPGEFTLSGYLRGCSTSKTITITSTPDPSDRYSKTIYWCESTPLTLTLPNDSAGLTFFWTDAYAGWERPVTSAGEYKVDIRSGNCTFQGSYTVIRNDDSECTDMEECTVSIPNAVTPNGDGRNDELSIFLSPECGAVESVTLWDKWGGLRYQTSSANLGTEAWEGLPTGIYIVQVNYVNETGMRMTETGSVLLIK